MSVTTSVHDFITDYLNKDAVSFHMPGHKGSHLYRRFGYHQFLDRMMDYDITEIAGSGQSVPDRGDHKGRSGALRKAL